MLPSRRRGHSKFYASENIVQMLRFAGIGSEERVAVEIPLAGQTGIAVGVAGSHAQRDVIAFRHAAVRALPRARGLVVSPPPVAFELIAEEVVVEASVGAGQR